MLCVTLFGSMSVSLHRNGGTVPLSLSPRVAELLAFLALGRGRYFLRSELAESVWHADEAEVNPGTVNTALWRLRRAIEHSKARAADYLVTDRCGGIGLNGGARISVDICEFDHLLAPCRATAPEHLTAANCRDLQTAIDMYRDGAPAACHGIWALRERERLRYAYVDAVRRLMERAERRHDHAGAIHFARLLLLTDPLREDVHRQLMRSLLADGQRAGALRQFEQCRDALQRELAIHPMRETLALYRQISNSAVGPAAAPMMGPAEPTVSRRRAQRLPVAAAHAADHVLTACGLLAEVDRCLQRTLELWHESDRLP